jgi:hypothetical protein
MADEHPRAASAATDSRPAATGAAPTPAIRPPERDELHVDWRLWSATGGLFIVTVVVRVVDKVHPLLHSLTLAALLVVMAILFVACFTGDAQRRIKDMFVFAYAFTFGSFAMLTLPFVADSDQATGTAWRTKASSLELVRGCVREGAMGGLTDISAVVLCPSGASVKAGAKPDAWPVNRPTRYSLLLAIGGVTATVEPDAPLDLAASAAAAPSTPSATSTSTSTSTSAASGGASAAASASPVALSKSGAERWHVEVVGGLAVPFFVLVMSFIGGAVSLSRRVPEYQRRLNPDYKGTLEQCNMREFEVREAVVFQIMQLISAPFLAIATWYIVSPSTLASAATLAFGTGFASESLLLMIRGLVNGIRPENMRFPATPAENRANPDPVAPKPDPVVLKGVVLPLANEPLPEALTLALRADGDDAVLEQLAVAPDGQFAFAPRDPGRYRLQPASGSRAFKPLAQELPAEGLADLKIQLEAEE